jgi:hypothetical protein
METGQGLEVELKDLEWQRCRKVPVIVEYASIDHLPKKVFIDTREGVLLALPGRDYIIKGVDGELYPIRKDIFERTYQKIISTVVE